MWWYLLIPVALFVAAFAADQVLLGLAVRRELQRRPLVRVRGDDVVTLVNPAPGWRVAETGTFTRDRDRLQVIVMARGWFRHELSVREEPADQGVQIQSRRIMIMTLDSALTIRV